MAYSYGLQEVMAQWQSIGVFEYLLPFLLIFAIVFVLLANVPSFKDKDLKGMRTIIAIAIGLLSLQPDFHSLIVSRFFASLFPKFGMGIAILLVILTLVSIFADYQDKDKGSGKYVNYALIGVGLIVALVIISNTFQEYGWTNSFYGNNAGMIIGGILVLALIIIVAVNSK